MSSIPFCPKIAIGEKKNRPANIYIDQERKIWRMQEADDDRKSSK